VLAQINNSLTDRHVSPLTYYPDKIKKNQKQELPVVAMLFNESGQNEQYL
jgi:hypothetical protein